MTWLPVTGMALLFVAGIAGAIIEYRANKRATILGDPHPSTIREAFRDNPRLHK